MSINDTKTPFDHYVVDLATVSVQQVPDKAEILDALVAVADTAYACKLWCESEGLKATAADIVAMTSLVLREKAAAISRRDGAGGA